MKYRKNLNGWEFDKDVPISASGEIKKSHRYYYQMQHQMFATNKKLTFFYIWTKHPKQKNFLLLEVPQDGELISALLMKYERCFSVLFYQNWLLEKIAQFKFMTTKNLLHLQTPMFSAHDCMLWKELPYRLVSIFLCENIKGA